MPTGVYLKTEEHKKKIGDALKGRGIGKKLSEETKKRMSESKKGKHMNCGENNPSWKGGISKEAILIRQSIQYKLWRNSVFSVDNFTCQKCKKRGIYLIAHHIKLFSQYPELRFAIDNGITFCKECHFKFHNKYGRKNNTKEQIDKFLSQKRKVKED